MKKLLPIMVVGILVLGGLGAVAGTDSNEEGFLSKEVVFSQPIIYEEENYISIELAEANSNFWAKDKPVLPVVTKVYTFPFGTSIDNVEVTFSDVVEQEVSKLIKPTPETLPVSINAIKKIKEPDAVVSYSDIEIYPENRFSYRTGAGLKDREEVIYLTVSLNPVQYNPNENKIYYSESAFIDITFTPPENPVIFPDEYDLLIITPAEFESALQTLVDHKNGLDPPVRTIMVSLDDIPSSGGADEQEDIKLYIRDAKETWGIDYVILVGAGVEGQELFPVRYAWLSDEIEDSFPSDLYYADFYNSTGGFPNWDKDGDGKYAEWPGDMANVDVIPDVYLGKIPANNVGEVNNFVNKIIDYKAHNKMTKKIFQVGGDTFVGNSQMEGEAANEAVMTKLPGYSTTQLWATNGEMTKGNIAKGFKGGVDFADFSGHGSPRTWATHPENDDSIWIPGMTLIAPWDTWASPDYGAYNINDPTKLSVVFLNACSNNKYTKKEDCLGWKTLTVSGGGIATFAASGIGYGVPNDETSRRFGWMEVQTFDELYNNKILGLVWGNCITNYYNTFESTLDFYDYKTMVQYSMFGDPTLAIQDGDDPRSVPVNRPVFNGVLERLMESFPILQRLLQQLRL